MQMSMFLWQSDTRVQKSIHPFSIPAYHKQGHRALELTPMFIGQKAGYVLDRFLSYHRANTQTQTNSFTLTFKPKWQIKSFPFT